MGSSQMCLIPCILHTAAGRVLNAGDCTGVATTGAEAVAMTTAEVAALDIKTPVAVGASNALC